MPEHPKAQNYGRGSQARRCRPLNSRGGKAHGTLVCTLTIPPHIKGHKVAASPDAPHYLVETDDGKRAAHKPDARGKA